MTSEDEEFLMSAQVLFEQWEREGEAKGFRMGFEEGLTRGLIESLLLAYRARFGSVPEDIQHLVEAAHTPETLRRWGALLLTATPESFAQAVRDAQH